MKILSLEQKNKVESLEDFKKGKNITSVIDSFEEQLHELFLIRNPKFRFIKEYESELINFTDSYLNGSTLENSGQWFFFPWNNTLIHYLNESEHLELRTARNKNLITSEEQTKYYNSVIGVAGLSVGSHAALTIVMTGGAKTIKLADPDTVSISNLNRIRYGATVLGKKKAIIAAQYIAEINPYAKIQIFDEGVSEENIQEFVSGNTPEEKIDILLEGVDNLAMKIRLRECAKKEHVPVIMATDNGDGIIVDVERYDLNPEQPLFNGVLGNITFDDFKNFNPQELPKLATKVAGPGYIVPRMLASLMEVGKTLYSWPQLGTAATFTGVATAYLTRSILNGRKIVGGKYDINLEKIFDEEIKSNPDQYTEEQKKHLSMMGL